MREGEFLSIVSHELAPKDPRATASKMTPAMTA
jgi:hypothetical protein